MWATQAQVITLMGAYDPAILTADPPSISGPEHLMQAIGFVDDVKPTFFFAGYTETDASTSGWTATPLTAAGASYSYPFFSASFWAAAIADEASQYRGVWLWRPADDDLTPPVIQPTVTGTAGANGWYTSNVAVSWSVQDAESTVTSKIGCGAATVAADTKGRKFTCTATSSGGTATATTLVKRDTVAPAVTCGATSTFELYKVGAAVSATVTDATSGPAQPTVQAIARTNAPGTFTATLTGTDRAGLRRSVACAYRVVVPACNGLAPTIVGTGANNTITGTSGRDVIVGLAGADTINGMGGDDVICGGDGPDTIIGGDGNDWVDGGASNDDLNGGNGDDFLDGGLNTDSIRGDGGRDTCLSGETRMSSCEA